MTPNAQAQRSAAWMPHGEGTLSFGLHPSALSEAAPRFRCSLLLGGELARSFFPCGNLSLRAVILCGHRSARSEHAPKKLEYERPTYESGERSDKHSEPWPRDHQLRSQHHRPRENRNDDASAHNYCQSTRRQISSPTDQMRRLTFYWGTVHTLEFLPEEKHFAS